MKKYSLTQTGQAYHKGFIYLSTHDTLKEVKSAQKEETKEKLLCVLNSNVENLVDDCTRLSKGWCFELTKDEVIIKLQSFLDCVCSQKEIVDVQKAYFFWQKDIIKKRLVEDRSYKAIYRIIFNGEHYEISKQEYDGIIDKRNEHLELKKTLRDKNLLVQLNKLCNNEI